MILDGQIKQMWKSCGSQPWASMSGCWILSSLNFAIDIHPALSKLNPSSIVILATTGAGWCSNKIPIPITGAAILNGL